MTNEKAKTPRAVVVLFCLLLLVAGLRMLHVSRTTSLTFDEPVHIAAGILYWETGSFRYNREHPPVMKLVAAIPNVLSGARAEFENVDGLVVDRDYAQENKWDYADRVVHENVVDPLKLTRRARTMMILVTLWFAGMVFFYGKSLFGPWQGLAAASLFLLDPNILAHGPLVKNDLGLAGFVLASFAFMHRYHKEGQVASLAMSSAMFALALGTKLSALAVLPVFAGFTLWIAYQKAEGAAKKRAIRAGLMLLLALVIADVVLNAVYGFSSLHHLQRGIGMLGEHRDTGHPSFLFGQVSGTGWWYYFPVALALKTPLPVLVLWAFAFASLPRVIRQVGWTNVAILLVPPGDALRPGCQLTGEYRHPPRAGGVPFLAVLSSGLLSKEVVGTWGRRLAAALVLLLVPVSLAAHPNHLSYFNAFGGDTEQRIRLLSDSNLDWGQDLPRLKRWMDENDVPNVYLLYFGTARPGAHGITAVPLRVAFSGGEFLPSARGPDWVVISATKYQGVYGSLDLIEPFRERKPDVLLGDTLRVYYIGGDKVPAKD